MALAFTVCNIRYIAIPQTKFKIVTFSNYWEEPTATIVLNFGMTGDIVDNIIYVTTTTVLRPFFRNHPGEPVPEENFWPLWFKGRLTEADTLTIRLGATPNGLTSAHLHHTPIFLQGGCPSCHPANSVKALKATSAFGLGRRR